MVIIFSMFTVQSRARDIGYRQANRNGRTNNTGLQRCRRVNSQSNNKCGLIGAMSYTIASQCADVNIASQYVLCSQSWVANIHRYQHLGRGRCRRECSSHRTTVADEKYQNHRRWTMRQIVIFIQLSRTRDRELSRCKFTVPSAQHNTAPCGSCHQLCKYALFMLCGCATSVRGKHKQNVLLEPDVELPPGRVLLCCRWARVRLCAMNFYSRSGDQILDRDV